MNDKSTTDQRLLLGPNHYGEDEEVRGGTGRGFLWGALAREATQWCSRDDSKTGNRIPPGTARSRSGPEEMVLEIPPLAGSSKLSSRAISGVEKALAWTDVKERTTSYSISSRCVC